MPAYQIQVQGTLDGVTPFSLPSPVPAPSDGGVIKIDAGAGVNVGLIDLNELALTFSTPAWIRVVHVEYSAATRAGRLSLRTNGSREDDLLMPDTGAVGAAPLLRPLVLTPGAIAPKGAQLVVLNDDTGVPIGFGVPVAGPHFIYIDVEPVRSDEDLGLIANMMSFSGAKGSAQGQKAQSNQAVAADLIEEIAIVAPPTDRDVASMQVQSIFLTNGDVAAAGETMVININRIEAGTGTVTLLGTFTIDNTLAANSVVEVPIDSVTNNLGLGDRIQVDRDYTAGGGPTPITNTSVRVELVPVAY